MQVFKTSLKLILQNKIGILIYILIPLVMTLLFVNTQSDPVQTFTESKVRIVLYNDDPDSDFTNGLVDWLAEQNTRVAVADERRALENALFNNVDLAFRFPQGFGAAAVESLASGQASPVRYNLLRAGFTTYEQTQLDLQISDYLSSARTWLTANPKLAEQDLVQKVRQNLAIKIDPTLQEPPLQTLDRRFYGFFIFLTYGLLAALLMIIGLITTVFNEPSVQLRNFCSPVRPRQFLRRILLTGISIMALIWLIFIGIAALMFRGQMLTVQGGLIILNSFVYAIFCFLLSYFVSQFFTSSETALFNGVVNVLPLILSFLCGVFIDLKYLGAEVETIARFLPTYWSIKTVTSLRDATQMTAELLRSSFTNMGIVLLFALAQLLIILLFGQLRVQRDSIRIYQVRQKRV